MIYECPNCHVPQAAGQTSCYNCRAEFSGPVPADATVPEKITAGRAPGASPAPEFSSHSARPQAVYSAPPETRPQTSAAPQTPLPPSINDLPQPSQSPFADWSPSRWLMIGVPILLVLIVGAIIFLNNRSAEPVAVAPSIPPDMSAPGQQPMAPNPIGIPISPGQPASGGGGSAMVLPGNSGNSSPAAPNQDSSWLIGRWQNKATDFYLFNQNGTGQQNTVSGKLAKGKFLWALLPKEIVLYADSDPPKKMPITRGSDDKSLYIRDDSGHFVLYLRTPGGP